MRIKIDVESLVKNTKRFERIYNALSDFFDEAPRNYFESTNGAEGRVQDTNTSKDFWCSDSDTKLEVSLSTMETHCAFWLKINGCRASAEYEERTRGLRISGGLGNAEEILTKIEEEIEEINEFIRDNAPEGFPQINIEAPKGVVLNSLKDAQNNETTSKEAFDKFIDQKVQEILRK
ncbi:hypothetical protein FACS189425_01390 [Clostridia bacterium]|nr:hypothetical protein FACS189425_01390 [Clostridia bacterium]